MTPIKSIQELVEPQGVCFGCGRKNPHGLHLESFPQQDGSFVAEIMPDARYCGWPDLAYGGFLAMLVDCHSNWTAIGSLYAKEGREPGSLPRITCVTAKLCLSYHKPTPMGRTLQLRARPEGPVGRKTRVICEVYAGDLLTVSGDSLFVRADPALLANKAGR